MAQKATAPTTIAGFEIDPGSVNLLPYLFCVNNNVAILGKMDPESKDPVYIGMVDMTDFQTIEIISRKFRNRPIKPVPLTPTDITKALTLGYQQSSTNLPSQPSEALLQDISSGDRYEMELGEGGIQRMGGLETETRSNTGESVIIGLVDKLLLDAIKRGSTDVHIEHFEDQTHLRYKIDGLLYTVTSPLNKSNADQVVSRLKVMSNLDIAEKRMPQDGRLLFVANQKKRTLKVPFRLSILPGPFGEDVVLRVLDKSMAPIDLELLGFKPEQLAEFRRLIHNPQGLILSAGPTGSGKTTTLYGTLKEIQTPHNKILSAEDPIEYTLPGVCQKQVSKYFGFADLARAFLRHDPDILLIGEIRDEDTADIAIKAAQTGHLLLSTLHTNDSVGAIPRLKSLGISPNLVASSLIGVLSQRLVRRVCKYCRMVYQPADEFLAVIGDHFHKEDYIKGRGCPRCYNTGYMGRIAIFELLNIDQSMQWLIQTEANEQELYENAVANGMRLLLSDGLSKIADDITTIEEIMRVIPYRQVVAQVEMMRKYDITVQPQSVDNG